MKKATILCVLGFAAMMLAAMSVPAQEHSYVGAAKCKMCHKVEYTSWEQTGHAKATEVAKNSTERKFDSGCLKCHATDDSEQFPGVQCEACHEPGSDYIKMSIMKDKQAAIANGLVIPDQQTCNTCHTGEDHAKKVDFAKELHNKNAIHEFKNPPAGY